MDIVNRLKKYMEHVGLPSTQFADYANIPRPTISQILNGRNRKISNELITKLHVAFPNLNVLWLMFGDGEMEVGLPAAPEPTPAAPEPTPAAPDLFSAASAIPPTNTPVQTTAPDITKAPGAAASLAGSLHNTESHIPLRPGKIEDFVEQNKHTHPLPSDKGTDDAGIKLPVSQNRETAKKIQTIMVFYNDNSYEIFSPSK